VEIVKTQRVRSTIFLSQVSVPIDLVGQLIPGKPDDRNTVISDTKHICPFLPKPINRLVAVRPLVEISLSVHHGNAKAVVVLPGYLGVSENFAGGFCRAVLEHAMLVGYVVVV